MYLNFKTFKVAIPVEVSSCKENLPIKDSLSKACAITKIDMNISSAVVISTRRSSGHLHNHSGANVDEKFEPVLIGKQ